MKNKFKVGDRVRIRQWDDMVKEFGLTDNGHIPFTKTCGTTFVDGMKHLCGRTATITSINYDIEEVDLDFDDKSGDTNWYFFLGAIEGEKTMDKQERIKELKKQIEEIKAEINELERDDTLEQYESDLCWEDESYILNELGYIDKNNSTFNLNEYNPYRHYMTMKYADKAAKIKKFNDMLMAFKYCYDRDYEPDWTTNYAKYRVVYNSDANPKCYCVVCNHTYRNNAIYFSSENIAQKCADWLNDIDPNGELIV